MASNNKRFLLRSCYFGSYCVRSVTLSRHVAQTYILFSGKVVYLNGLASTTDTSDGVVIP